MKFDRCGLPRAHIPEMEHDNLRRTEMGSGEPGIT